MMRNLETISSRKKEFGLTLAVLVLLCLGLAFSLMSDSKQHRAETPQKVAAATDPFAGVDITAKAAYVYDLKTNTILYAKNADSRLPLASLTKVMTALVATELGSPNSEVTITKTAVNTDGNSGLLVGEHWGLKNLLDFSLVMSSNDGMRATALAIGAMQAGSGSDPESAFINSMNREADYLHMRDTYYMSDTGLDLSQEKGGAYGSARDEAMLFGYILQNHPDILEATKEKELRVASNEKVHLAKNTDIIVNDIPNLLASKTGYTDLAGGNLVIAFDAGLNRPIIISVLGSTYDGRFSDMETLVNKAMQAVTMR